MIDLRRFWLVLLLALAACRGDDGGADPAKRLLDVYLAELEGQPGLTIKRQDVGMWKAHFDIRSLDVSVEGCPVGRLTFVLPQGMSRVAGTTAGVGGCTNELNGPGHYRGSFEGVNCRLTFDVYGYAPFEDAEIRAICRP